MDFLPGMGAWRTSLPGLPGADRWFREVLRLRLPENTKAQCDMLSRARHVQAASLAWLQH